MIRVREGKLSSLTTLQQSARALLPLVARIEGVILVGISKLNTTPCPSRC